MSDGSPLGQFIIPADHPALPGHFPGNPVVPGVVLLDHALALLERAGEARPATIPQVKFTGVVRPGDVCEVTVTAGRRGRGLEVRVNGHQVLTARLPAA